MGSFTERESFPGFDDALAERDKRYGTDRRKKMELRKNIKEPELHPGRSSSLLHGQKLISVHRRRCS